MKLGSTWLFEGLELGPGLLNGWRLGPRLLKGWTLGPANGWLVGPGCRGLIGGKVVVGPLGPPAG